MYQPSLSTILVVEQDLNLGAIINEALKNKYQVRVKRDSATALTYLFQGNLPDLIILDYNREEIEIQELLFELQQNRFFKHIPLVLLGNDPLLSATNTESFAVSHHLIGKPFNPEKILAYTDKILNRSEHVP